jgi:hypothetical protein
MKPEKQHLIRDLFDPQSEVRREVTLQAGARVLRRRRWRRYAGRVCVGMLLLTLALVSLQRMSTPRVAVSSAVSTPTEPATRLTDEELLGMFPDTPVGLATMADGRKRLIFPRAGDEARFLKRL